MTKGILIVSSIISILIFVIFCIYFFIALKTRKKEDINNVVIGIICAGLFGILLWLIPSPSSRSVYDENIIPLNDEQKNAEKKDNNDCSTTVLENKPVRCFFEKSM